MELSGDNVLTTVVFGIAILMVICIIAVHLFSTSEEMTNNLRTKNPSKRQVRRDDDKNRLRYYNDTYKPTAIKRHIARNNNY
tara:strand:- start:46 stop:291 length:246 start_codon:yes stop_codon:yes gene_type:complete